MKILQITPAFPPSNLGGIKASSHALSKGLVKKGYEVTVYTTDIMDGRSRLNDVEGVKKVDGINVYYFKNLSNSLASKHHLFLPIEMIKTMRKEIKNFDIIHLQDYRNFQCVIAYYYAKKNNIPFVLQAHGSIPRMHVKKRLKWLFDVIFGYKILRDSSRAITDSKVGINDYKEAGVNPDKIILIPLAHDNVDFSQLPPACTFKRKFGIKERHIILYLGRIHWIKGLDFLVESFHMLAQERDDVILVIVGVDDGYKSDIETLIEKLNLSKRVLFTGFVNEEDKLSALVDASVVVQPSRYEHAAWAPFEAILCDTPIVVSKNTGSGEDVSEIDAGYLVEHGNKKELRDTIQKILDNPDEAMNKTQNAKRWIIANLSMEKQIEKYEKLYKEAVADFYERKDEK